MNKLHTLSVLSLFLCLVSCATAYGPKGYSGGYEDFDLGNGKFQVEFYGNGYTHRSDVQQMALRRAREVCQEHGFKTGDIMNVGADTDQSLSINQGYQQTEFQTVTKATAKVLVQCK